MLASKQASKQDDDQDEEVGEEGGFWFRLKILLVGYGVEGRDSCCLSLSSVQFYSIFLPFFSRLFSPLLCSFFTSKLFWVEM